MQEDNSGFSLLLDLLSELYQKQPKIGYHLLYYLRARWVWPGPWERLPRVPTPQPWLSPPGPSLCSFHNHSPPCAVQGS